MGMTVEYGTVTKHYSKGLTNRRCLLIFGAILTVAGIAGFFLPSNPRAVFELGVGQSIAYLVLGLASLAVGEVWNSDYKRVFLVIEGLFFLVIAIAGFIAAGMVNSDYGINLGIFHVQHPWENALHLLLGAIFVGTALYPRHFRDYSFASNVSD